MKAVCRLCEDTEIGIRKQATSLRSSNQLKVQDMVNKRLAPEVFCYNDCV